MLRAILFDIDGTLIDSNDAHAESFRRALSELGREVSFLDVRRLIGMGSDHLLPTLIGVNAESEEGRAICARKGVIFTREFLPELKAFPGARALLKHLSDLRLQLAVVTSGAAEDAEKLLAIESLGEFFTVRVDADDVDRSKPSADPVTAALAKLKFTPNEVLMVGDTPYDVRAAEAAGVRSIAVRSGGWDTTQLGNALAVFSGPDTFLTALRERMTGPQAYLAPLFYGQSEDVGLTSVRAEKRTFGERIREILPFASGPH